MLSEKWAKKRVAKILVLSNSSPPGVFHWHLIKILDFDRGQDSKMLSMNLKSYT